MGWAVDAVADYVDNIRPRFGCADHAALWVTERGGRIKPAEINARFVAWRDAPGLPKNPVPHSIRIRTSPTSPRMGLTGDLSNARLAMKSIARLPCIRMSAAIS
jgi:site-specific recombinase XerC